jgi:hypothetical protein
VPGSIVIPPVCALTAHVFPSLIVTPPAISEYCKVLPVDNGLVLTELVPLIAAAALASIVKVTVNEAIL